MKIFVLVGVSGNKATLIDGPSVDDMAPLKAQFDAILDAHGEVSKGKGKTVYDELILRDLVTGDGRRRKC